MNHNTYLEMLPFFPKYKQLKSLSPPRNLDFQDNVSMLSVCMFHCIFYLYILFKEPHDIYKEEFLAN